MEKKKKVLSEFMFSLASKDDYLISPIGSQLYSPKSVNHYWSDTNPKEKKRGMIIVSRPNYIP